MARDSSGAFSLGAGNPVVTLTTITSAWANATLSDMGQELTNSLDRNGRGAMLAPLKGFSGSVVLPGFTWDAEVSTGWYRAAVGDMRFSVLGIRVAGIDASGLNQGDGNAAPTFYPVGFRGVPQNSQSAAYTLVLSDAGKHVYHPSADVTARIFTIPANAAVAYPIGTAMTIVNDSGAGILTITITTDVLVWAPSGGVGNRTMAPNGVATLLKVTATRWQITGVGLT